MHKPELMEVTNFEVPHDEVKEHRVWSATDEFYDIHVQYLENHGMEIDQSITVGKRSATFLGDYEGNQVCVKIFANQYLPNEVRMLEQIRKLGGHLNIVHPLHMYQIPFHNCYIYVLVMPFIPCEKSIVEYRQSEDRDFILEQLLETLVFLHAQKIMHCDIKPSNLLIDPNTSQLTLIDFEFAETNTCKMYHGTEGFLAPEIINRQWYDEKVDMFGFGCVVLSLLTGVEESHFPSTTEERDKLWKTVSLTHPWQPMLQHCLDPNSKTRWSAQTCLDFFTFSRAS